MINISSPVPDDFSKIPQIFIITLAPPKLLTIFIKQSLTTKISIIQGVPFHWSCCVALRLALFVSPSLVRYAVIVRPMKPRQPTSMGITWQAHPLSSHSMCRFSYRSFFLLKASSMFSSQGTVSPTMMMRFTVSDHITMSGHSWVCTMWCGKWRASFRSAAIPSPLLLRATFALVVCWARALWINSRASYSRSPPALKGVSGSSNGGMPSIGGSGTSFRGSE